MEPNALKTGTITTTERLFNPTTRLPTALIDVSRLFPSLPPKTTILAKLSGGNIKSLPVFNMLAEAQKRGELEGVDTLVEATSGNTGEQLTILAKFFGIKNVVTIVPEDIAPGKLQRLHIAGAKIKYSNEGERATDTARRLGKRPGWLNLDQYTNADNWGAFEKFFAPEVWQQTNGGLTIFCATLGTTGTLLGCEKFFKTLDQKPCILGATCDTLDQVPGARSTKRLAEIGFDCKTATFPIELDISAPISFSMSMVLNRHNVLAGPTSGLACYALLRFIYRTHREKKLDQYRNKEGDVVAVFVCPDTPLPYLDKYTTHLPGYKPVEEVTKFL